MPTAYGYVNVCHFAHRPEGDTAWFRERLARDTALEAHRDRAVRDGLDPLRARVGIYPILAPLSDDIEAILSAQEREETF